MKKKLKLLTEWSSHAEDDSTRAALWYLAGISSGLTSLSFEVVRKGVIRDCRYLDQTGAQPFSFTTNKKWLLFYFRPPAIRSGRYSSARLADTFESFSENPSGEWTVRIRDVAEAEELARYLGWLRQVDA